MSNNIGYFKFPRELLQSAEWKSLSLEYRHIFITLMANVAYAPTKQNDHGKIIDVKPGQILTTYRDLVRLCDEKGIDLPKMQRALKRLKEVGFSIHETIHLKTLITITEPIICKMINESIDTRIDTQNDTRTIHKRRSKEEKKRTTPPTPSNEGAVVVSFEKSQDNEILEILSALPKLNPKDQEALTSQEKKSLLKYLKKIPLDRIKLAVEFFNLEKPNKGYVAAMRWHCDEPIPPISEFTKEKLKQEIALLNKKFAEKAEREFSSEYYKVEALNQSVLISPKGPNGDTDMIEYSANGFEDRFGLLLRKRNFSRSKIANEACLIYTY